MILVSLHLRNYKQYAGDVDVEFPSEGAVAIIGNNGAGKTTLFEAIEWCLYSPREIAGESILTRGGVGEPSVKLVLEDPATSERYVVERRRKRRSVEAEVYKESAPDAPLVTGTREVTDFVARQLIGLGHRAFVSTFFTRQKELSFFGEMRDTERRREVAQLLGFETIRVAQGLLGDQRTAARNDAQALSRQYAIERGDRDFDQERSDVEAKIAATANAVAGATVQVANASRQRDNARAESDRMDQLYSSHSALQAQIEARGGDMRAAQRDIAAAEATLRQLDADAALRTQLLPEATDEPNRRATLKAHEEERDRYQEAKRLADVIDRAAARLTDAPRQLAQIVRAVPAAAGVVAGWDTVPTEEHFVPHLQELETSIAGLDLDGANARARATHDAFQSERELVQATSDREQAEEALRSAEQDRAQLVASGDPLAAHAAAVRARDDAAAQRVKAKERGESIRFRKEERQSIIDQIWAAAAGPECPTCHQPLSPAAARVAVAPLADQVRIFDLELETLRADFKLASTALHQAEAEVAQLDRARSALAALDGQLESLRRTLRDRETAQQEASSRVQAARSTLCIAGPISVVDVDRARDHARLVGDLVANATGLAQLRRAVEHASHEHDVAATERAALGPVSYDAAAHVAARDAHAAARDAMSRIVQIDNALSTRPDHDLALSRANMALAEAKALQKALMTEQATLGFNDTELQVARVARDDAERALRAADKALEAARHTSELAKVEQRNLLADQKRIENLELDAQARKRDWEELERMYKEFGRFDQYVSQTVTPELANYTGELLAEVTDRKYDQVRFDENYGLHVFDGPESFPIGHFSGGERDVAALCARLSLSRFIAAQAVRPPRFLVLDEVFGSLDADRRHQLLQALLQLAGSDGPFRQLFIISHVDDVRSSPALDEVWRVREQNGSSTIENVSRTGAIEEF